jgi:hypothetical protein
MKALDERLKTVMQIAHEYGIEDDIKREEQKMEDDKKNV